MHTCQNVENAAARLSACVSGDWIVSSFWASAASYFQICGPSGVYDMLLVGKACHGDMQLTVTVSLKGRGRQCGLKLEAA